MRVILDTGPLVALLNRRDIFHGWSVEQAGRLAPPFHSCEAVVAEAHFLLGRAHKGTKSLIDLLNSGRILLSFSVADHHHRVGELMLRYSDVPMSFADACLVCMAEQQRSTIFTLDSDFTIYRKHQKEPLQLISP